MTRPFANRNIMNVMTIAVTFLSLLTAVWIATREQPFPKLDLPKREYRNTLNINREQYRVALAKWNDLHVTDYEATVQHTNWGKWKIVVHVDEAYGSKYAEGVRASYSHRMVQFESLDGEAANPGVNDVDFIMTVGQLFDWVNDDLYCQENSCEQRDFFAPSRYVIEFDDAMGYPRSRTSINESGTVEIRIENVKILK